MASDGLDQKERHFDRTMNKPRMLSRRHIPGMGRKRVHNPRQLQEERPPAFHCPKCYPRNKIRKPAEAGLA